MSDEKEFIEGFVNELPFEGCFKIAIKPAELKRITDISKKLGKNFVEIEVMQSKAGKKYLTLSKFVPKKNGNDQEIPF